MTTRSWIRRLFNRKPRTIRKAPLPHPRPALEMLEERTLLSLTPTSLALSVSSPALVCGQSETLTAVITTPPGSPAPTSSDGTVSFYSGATLLGSAPLSGSPATATLTTKALPGGTDYVTARYSGDSSFTASSTAPSGNNFSLFTGLVPAPYAVAVDGAGAVYVTDFLDGTVSKVVKPGATPVTIASGLNGPKGVAVDAAGDVFVADTGNNQVLEIKPGVAPTTFVSQLSGPQGLAVDGAGNVYIADTGNNRVLKVTADGSQQTTVGTNLSGPTGVAVDALGDVCIADAGNNQVVEVAAADGSQTPVTSGSGITGVAVDDNGDLFVAAYSQYGAWVKEVAGGSESFFGDSMTFIAPYGVAVDSHGDLFVADAGTWVVDESSGGVPVTVSAAPTTLSLSAASSTLYNGQGATFTATLTSSTGPVPGPGDGSVTFYNGATVLGSAPLSAQGKAVFTTAALPVGTSLSVTATYSGDNNFAASHFGIQAANPQRVVPATGLSLPGGLAVDNLGDLLIADTHNNRVIDALLGSDGSVLQILVCSGLHQPTGVAADVGPGFGNLDVFITDTNSNQMGIAQVDNTLKAISGFSPPLNHPSGMAVDSQGDVYFADAGNNRVVEIKSDGTNASYYAGSSSSPLNQPQDVAVDSAGDLFIADTGNNRIVEFNPSSGIESNIAIGLNAPTGVAVDGAGDLFIADTGNNRVVELTANAGQVTIGSGLLGPQAVAVDDQGDVFIADTGNNRVVEVTPRVNVKVVGPTPTAITLSVASQTLTYGQTETLTATVTVPGGATLPGSGDGTVTFYDGSKELGTEALSGSPATASLTTAPLTPGEHQFTATYSGDSSFLPSRSTVQPQSAEAVALSSYNIGGASL